MTWHQTWACVDKALTYEVIDQRPICLSYFIDILTVVEINKFREILPYGNKISLITGGGDGGGGGGGDDGGGGGGGGVCVGGDAVDKILCFATPFPLRRSDSFGLYSINIVFWRRYEIWSIKS